MLHINNTISFIREIYNEPTAFIPLHAPVFIGNEKKYLNECIDSTFVSSVGKFVNQFEDSVAEYTGAKKAIVTVNGTAALHVSLKAVGVEHNDEVITQPLTFVATANAISYCGADPVFIDVDNDTLGLSPSKLKTWLQENVKTDVGGKPVNKISSKVIKACVPMHTFGHPCRIDEIVEICNTFNIPVIEDAAESLGSTYKGKHTGLFGKIGVLSFNGNKTITTGGGGMIITNDIALGEHVKHITNTAKAPHQWEYAHDHIGYNYRMPNINAALGLAQVENLPQILENKLKTAAKYKSFFANTPFSFIDQPQNATSNFWLNAIALENKEARDAFLKKTNDSCIMTRPIWKLMNDLPMFRNAITGDISNASALVDKIVNIPSSYCR